MTTVTWLSGAAAIAFLALALAAGAERGRRPLAIHVGLMSAGLFAYNLCETVSAFDASRTWVHLEDAAASVTAIPTIELFIAFVGKTRALRKLRYALRAYFTALAAFSALPIAVGSLDPARDHGAFAIPMLLGLAPGFGLVAWMLVRHERSSSGKERARTRLISASLFMGGGGIGVDLAAMAGADLPRVAHFGLVGSAVLVAAATLQLRIVDRPAVALGASVGAVGAVAVAALAVVYSVAAGRTALFVLGSLLVLVAFVAALRPLYASRSEDRTRAQYLVTLGRFSAQMAHDLRNPLAAIKGAGQFLREEHASGRPLEAHADFIDLIIERADRIEHLVADYQRMGRLELARQPTEPSAWLADLLRGQGLSDADGGVRLEARLAEGLPRVDIDRDLLGFAVENVVKNAREAMATGGSLVATTALTHGPSGDAQIAICLKDDGPGMDVRTLERALGGFFTTKPDGTGLGLAFAVRVVEAHGGSFRIESEEGRGTEVRIELPTA